MENKSEKERVEEICEIPKLTEEQKKEPRLVVEENGWQYHFSYGNLLWKIP